MASIVINGPPEDPAASAADPWLDSNDSISIQADEMFARQLDTGFAGEIRTLVHDPETGLAGKDPEDALGGVAEAMPMLGELKDRYLKQAIGPRQRSILEPLIDSRLDRAAGDLGRIAQQATSALDDRIVAERLTDLQQDAALAWHDPAHLRALGRTAVGELRYQGERRGWDEARTNTTVRQGLSDLYAGAVESVIGRDPEGADKLYVHAREVIQPERQRVIEHKMERARDERRVTGVLVSLADVSDDPTRRPDLDDYQARAAELAPSDASPDVRAQVNRMVRIEHAQADRAWQAARGRAAVAALDWLGKNPAVRLLAMPPELRDGLSPEQTKALDAVTINGGRAVTNRDIYELLDRQAIYEPKAFAGLDLSQYRLSLDDQDYQRFVSFQKGLVDGRPDVAFQRYDLGRSVLDEGFEKANFDLDGPAVRSGRTALEKTLGAFEAIQGHPATLEDIEHIAGDIVRRAVDSQDTLDGQEGTLDATAPSDGQNEASALHGADGEAGSGETQLAQVGGTSPRDQTPTPTKEEKERQTVETQRQKITERRKAELDRLAGIKIAPKPTEKQLMPEDWAQRLPAGVLVAVDASAKRYNVPRELLARVLWQESEFKEDSNHDKPVGRAKGIAGLEDGTKGIKAELQRLAGLRGDRARVSELQGYDVMNASQAIDMAAEYLRHSYERGGRTWPGAIAAYNFGPTAFDNWLSGRSDPTVSRDIHWRRAKEYLKYVFRGNPKAFDE
ncbi:MAG: transglycosylase SLT domain-containing protein [Reyranella sp.]